MMKQKKRNQEEEEEEEEAKRYESTKSLTHYSPNFQPILLLLLSSTLRYTLDSSPFLYPN